jgi:hypothetical protein
MTPPHLGFIINTLATGGFWPFLGHFLAISDGFLANPLIKPQSSRQVLSKHGIKMTPKWPKRVILAPLPKCAHLGFITFDWWPKMTPFGHIWGYMAQIPLKQAIYRGNSGIWAIFGGIWAKYRYLGHIWGYLAGYGPIWPYMAKYRYFGQIWPFWPKYRYFGYFGQIPLFRPNMPF